MDTAWIQIFVLTFAECVAPAGKTVCQEQQFELEFLTRSDCEAALEQLVTLKDASETVIVEKSKSRCTPSARQHAVFTNLEELVENVEDKQAFRVPDAGQQAPRETPQAHQARLEKLPSCEAARGVAPCKIGEIIIEETEQGEPVEVWRSQRD